MAHFLTIFQDAGAEKRQPMGGDLLPDPRSVSGKMILSYRRFSFYAAPHKYGAHRFFQGSPSRPRDSRHGQAHVCPAEGAASLGHFFGALS